MDEQQGGEGMTRGQCGQTFMSQDELDEHMRQQLGGSGTGETSGEMAGE